MAYKFDQVYSVISEYDWEGQHYKDEENIPFQFSVDIQDFKPIISYAYMKRFFEEIKDEETFPVMYKYQLVEIDEYITSLVEDNIMLPLALYSVQSEEYSGLLIATENITDRFETAEKVCNINLSELFGCNEDNGVSTDGLYNRCYLCGKLIKTGTNGSTNIYFRDTDTKFHIGCMKNLENEWRHFK